MPITGKSGFDASLVNVNNVENVSPPRLPSTAGWSFVSKGQIMIFPRLGQSARTRGFISPVRYRHENHTNVTAMIQSVPIIRLQCPIQPPAPADWRLVLERLTGRRASSRPRRTAPSSKKVQHPSQRPPKPVTAWLIPWV